MIRKSRNRQNWSNLGQNRKQNGAADLPSRAGPALAQSRSGFGQYYYYFIFFFLPSLGFVLFLAVSELVLESDCSRDLHDELPI